MARLLLFTSLMLSRREILIQLRDMGVKQQSLLKEYLRDFERYMKENYGLEVVKKRRGEKEEDPLRSNSDLPIQTRTLSPSSSSS